MKTLSIILAAFSMGTAPVSENTQASSLPLIQVVPEFREISGKEAIQAIRDSYEKGEYDLFLKELDDSYHKAQTTGGLDDVLAMRLGDFTQFEKWQVNLNSLHEKKRSQLLEAVSQEKDSIFADKVRSAASEKLTEKQQKAIDQVVKLRSMLPGAGAGNDENLLIDIDIEYEYKALQLYQMGLSPIEIREKHSALKMEHLDCLSQVSQQFQDAAWKEHIQLYTERCDQHLSQIWDNADLHLLINGKETPKNALEETVAQILRAHRDQMNALSQQVFANHETT